MTQNELRDQLRQVVLIHNDDERREAVIKLYEKVLTAIANGALRHRLLARDVLTLSTMRTTTSRTIF
jgi:hypothetical protein